jgi:C-terminal processing protease CtpA/Prc
MDPAQEASPPPVRVARPRQRLLRGSLCLIAVLTASRLWAQEIPDSIRLPRLAAVGRLYNAVRFFHPALGQVGIDWDGAVAEVLPAIRTAETVAEYRGALERLLTVLDDPATRVVDAGEPLDTVGHEPPITTRSIGDSVLVIRLLLGKAADFVGVTGALSALDSTVAAVHAVILDLRAPVGWIHPEETTGYVLRESGLAQRLLPGLVAAPGYRTRLHEGYQADDATTASNLYHQGWQITPGDVLNGQDSSRTRRTAVLVNERSELPSLALAVAASGAGFLIGEGAGSRAIGAETARLSLGEGLDVQLRLSELISAEGTTVNVIDTVVPAATGDTDFALATALILLQRPHEARRSREALPITPSPAKDEAASTSFPPTSLRLIALYRLWGAIQYFHAYSDLYDAPWEDQLERYIPRFEAARDSIEYGVAVAELMTHVHDSHGFVRAPGLRALWGRAPLPLHVRFIEGRAIVTHIPSDSLARGVRVGDEILSVDGEPLRHRITRISRLIPSSNKAGLRRDALDLALRGSDSSYANLRLRGANGQPRAARVERRLGYWDLIRPQRTGPVLKLLPGRIGYADLDRMPGAMVDSMFTIFHDAKGIILDMRGYPLGTAWAIAPRLTERRNVVAAQIHTRLARRPEGALGEVGGRERLESTTTQQLPERAGGVYRGWTVMLIDERTQSQAEHSGLFFEAANHTEYIGSQTAGANGDVTNVSLPGNITVWFTGLGVRHADGRQLQRIGLRPDIVVAPTIRGIRAGRDEVLERAVTYLRALPARKGAR